MHQVWCGHRASSLLGTPLGEKLGGRVAMLGLAHRGPDLALCLHPFPGQWVRPGCPGQPARASGPLLRVPRAKCAPAAYPLFRCWGRCEGSCSEHSTPDCSGRNTFLLGIPPTVHTHTQAHTPLPGSLSLRCYGLLCSPSLPPSWPAHPWGPEAGTTRDSPGRCAGRETWVQGQTSGKGFHTRASPSLTWGGECGP